MALVQAAVIGLIALIITPGFLFYFDITPKTVVLLAGAAAALLGCAAAGTVFRRFPGAAHRWFSILLLLNSLSLALSTALSSNPALSEFGTNWRRFGSVIQFALLLFAWLVASHTAGKPQRTIAILRAIALSGGLSALYGIAQYFGWDPFLPAAGYHIGEGVWTIVRPPGTLGYVSYFATWLLFVTFLSAALAAMDTNVWWRRVAWVCAAISTIAMLLTGTRAAVLGLLAGALWYLYWRRPRNLARIGAGVAVLALAAAVFYISPLGQNLRSRARWFSEDRSGGSRPTLWRDTLRMSVARLPAGYGPEVFTAAFAPYESKSLAEAYPDFTHESPHNIFLDALASQGLPGLLILAALCWLGLREHQGPSVWISAALAAGVVSQQFTVFTMPTAMAFFVTISLAIGLGSPPLEPRRNWLSALAVSPAAIALLYLAVRFTSADRALLLTQRAIDAGDLSGAVERYQEHLARKLPGTTSDLWYSRALLGLAQKTSDPQARYFAIAQSGTAGVRAARAAEDPFNAWYNLAMLYATQNDSRRTESCLRSAIAASPNWFKPHWTLAQLLRLEGRHEEAEREAAMAAELDAGKHAEVATTLAQIRAQSIPPGR